MTEIDNIKRELQLANMRIAELERTIRFFNIICPLRKTDRSYMEAPKVHKPKLLTDRKFSAEERVWRKNKKKKDINKNVS